MDQDVKRIKQEDKKAFKGFSILMVAALLVGLAAGVLTGLAENFFAEDIGNILLYFMQNILLPYGMPAVTVMVLAAVLILYGKAKRLFLSWDGEDEDVAEKADRYLSYALWLTSMNMIWIYFIFGTISSGRMWDSIEQSDSVVFSFVWILGWFILALIIISIEQQKIINLTKQMNPEKRGSVFDTKFKEKWEESCDEAEKLLIYKSAFKAYNVVQIECIVLWVLCLMGGFIWDFGILPIAVISIIWGTMTTVYCMESIKLSKKGAK